MALAVKKVILVMLFFLASGIGWQTMPVASPVQESGGNKMAVDKQSLSTLKEAIFVVS